MIDLLLEADERALEATLAELSALPRGEPGLVAEAEDEVARAPARAIAFDQSGAATLTAAGRVFAGGRFSAQSVGALRSRAAAATGRRAKARAALWVLCGADPRTDVGLLQATAAPGSLFQAASQFNCLEAPGPSLVRVADYFGDRTQGPRAAISCFPGALVRHYAAPGKGGERFVQTDARQLNLLEAALPRALAKVKGGYLMTQHLADQGAAAKALQDGFERICVGVHEDVEVALGGDFLGPVPRGQRIAQVYTSTLAVGYSDGQQEPRAVEAICRSLLRAAYLGTLLAAVATGQRRAVLTLIGGGVFGNPHPLIWESILWALDELDAKVGAPLEVVLNGREVERTLGLEALAAATGARGGAVVRLAAGRVERVA